MGYDTNTYKEFEIWYYRFSRGELDLDYDISSEPKTRDFCQIPTSVIEKILEKTTYKEQLTVRKVSRGLKSIVDRLRSSLKSIEVIWHSDHVKCRYDNQLVIYSKRGNIKYDKRDVIRVIDLNYEELWFQDWKFPMKNPKCRLEILKIECKEPNNRMREDNKINKLRQVIREIRNVLYWIRWKISVKKLEIDTFHPDVNQVKSILEYLEPGFLKSIKLLNFEL